MTTTLGYRARLCVQLFNESDEVRQLVTRAKGVPAVPRKTAKLAGHSTGLTSGHRGPFMRFAVDKRRVPASSTPSLAMEVSAEAVVCLFGSPTFTIGFYGRIADGDITLEGIYTRVPPPPLPPFPLSLLPPHTPSLFPHPPGPPTFPPPHSAFPGPPPF